jgi:hypothetical protein
VAGLIRLARTGSAMDELSTTARPRSGGGLAVPVRSTLGLKSAITMASPSTTPSWRTTQQPDGRPYREIAISEEPDWQLFEKVAATLQRSLAGQWTAQLDGLDERWWDFTTNGATVTLHLEHYTGIMVFPVGMADAEPGAVELLERVFLVLTLPPPTNARSNTKGPTA